MINCNSEQGARNELIVSANATFPSLATYLTILLVIVGLVVFVSILQALCQRLMRSADIEYRSENPELVSFTIVSENIEDARREETETQTYLPAQRVLRSRGLYLH